jgi:hypothetical protein
MASSWERAGMAAMMNARETTRLRGIKQEALR